MRVLAYRVVFETQTGADEIFAVLPAIPQVVASGATREAAIEQAELGLDAALALGGRHENFVLPEPDAHLAGADDAVVMARPLTAAKAFVLQAYRSSALSKSELARLTGLDEAEIRRVLDPRHRSKISRIAEVSAALGRPMTVAVAA